MRTAGKVIAGEEKPVPLSIAGSWKKRPAFHVDGFMPMACRQYGRRAGHNACFAMIVVLWADPSAARIAAVHS
jgi:hypothetical protein